MTSDRVKMDKGNTAPVRFGTGWIGGAIGGSLTAAILHPIDLIRYRYQVNDRSRLRPTYTSYYNAFKTTYQRYGGVQGFYTGASTNIVGNTLAWGGYFLFFENLKSTNYLKHSPVLESFAFGTLAGVLTLSFTNPIWVVKTQACLQYEATKSNRTGILDICKTILRRDGLAGFYRGYLPGLVSSVHGGVQMLSYSQIQRLTGLEGQTGGFVNGALAKCFTATLLYPLATVKIRLQEQHRQYNGIKATVCAIYQENGPRGYYQGLGLQLLRNVPASALTFMFYELFKRI